MVIPSEYVVAWVTVSRFIERTGKPSINTYSAKAPATSAYGSPTCGCIGLRYPTDSPNTSRRAPADRAF
ncbi:hypothetical protein Rhow_002159 [Rhodococcus wratislaviensis]|uniref:Uncharacterized protein n=1 Tax=Rhodococcus wratislaviensis TaxID=44752 RepID=A0A402C4R8_RHOWR|nr:hypothetical protein Rhow_002159 [Rhodococcus wratislaviensis]